MFILGINNDSQKYQNYPDMMWHSQVKFKQAVCALAEKHCTRGRLDFAVSPTCTLKQKEAVNSQQRGEKNRWRAGKIIQTLMLVCNVKINAKFNDVVLEAWILTVDDLLTILSTSCENTLSKSDDFQICLNWCRNFKLCSKLVFWPTEAEGNCRSIL